MADRRTPGDGSASKVPSKGLGWVSRRLSGRSDSEHEQAIVRIVIVVVLTVYFGALSLWASPDGAAFATGTLVAGAYGVVSFGLLAWIVAQPARHPVRRLIAMALDHTTLATLLVLGGSWGGALYPIYLWITFGNGFRYGNAYLAASSATSVAAFAIAGWINPFWHQNMALTVGLTLGLVVLPGYVASLIKKLTVAKRTAEAANAAKSRFLATMSHELRTPLNSVIGLADLLTAGHLDSEQRHMVRTIGVSGRTLLALINDVLDLAKVEAGGVRPDPVAFDLVGELSASVGMLRPEAARKDLSLALVLADDVPARAYGDVRYLRQILLNLLANAVKFTDAGGVSVRVEAVRHTETVELRVLVCDTGPGIKDSDREHIFQAFSQSDDTAHRRHEGTGLGLAIARQLAQGMGGSLNVLASSQDGSTFALQLPLDVVDDAHDDDIDGLRVRLVVPGGGTADDLDQALRAAGARTGPTGSMGAMVYDLRRLDAAQRLDDRWFDKLAAHAPPATPCILIGSNAGEMVSRLASRFHIAINVKPPVSVQGVRRALGLIVASASRGDGQLGDTPAGGYGRMTHGGRVLVVEDNPVNSMVTAKILETGGHSVIVAASGEAALDLLETESIDAVLMDVNMPGESGIETVQLLRFTEFGGDRPVPVIALTADATPETRQACLDAGMDDYVTKPVDARRLLDTLDSHLAASSHAEDAGRVESFAGSAPKVLDTGAIETLVELDPGGDFLIEVADEFVRDTRLLVSEIQTMLGVGDTERAADLLHGLKSAAGYAGAHRVRARASELHAEVSEFDAGDLSGAVAGLVREADCYRAVIARYTPKSAHQADAVPLPESQE